MNLNIKSPEARRLARAIAERTGQSITHVVIDALRERYAQIERRKGRASIDEILTIAARVSSQVQAPSAPHGELLYDEKGLPK
ncbi:antitoxin VapB [Sphingomonas laterariae]|uniref:Antitoxin VapB n=1 Tax=Edaphosphingomonas laterariae TaxID=861865 RepID=A0A239GLQ1_9SPHN|nr:type II toxin-antitoxin system VapB family antitoxin [Sphingomonas laterariae]SNS68994.1 antitoxin VapB [Sphingomonas laterariae]